MLAKFRGFCPLCKTAYEPGTEITKHGTKGWGHMVCPTKATAPVASARVEPQGKSYSAGLASTLAGLAMAAPAVAEVAAPAPTKVFNPSTYQRRIFEWMVFGSGNAVVEAVAGSGKTTTLEHLVKYILLAEARKRGLIPADITTLDEARLAMGPGELDRMAEGLRVVMLAFNTEIANVLGERMPAWCRTSTLHGLGFSDIRKAFPHIRQPDTKGEKQDAIAAELLPFTAGLTNTEKGAIRAARIALKKIGSLVRNTLTDPADPLAVAEVIDRYGVEFEGDEAELIRLVPQFVTKCRTNHAIIDFDDMVDFPALGIVPCEQFDYVLVDETQDLNKAQTVKVLRSVAPGGRVIAVGDRKQSLYGFRGADTEAIPNIIEALNAEVLPLSITYRCPTSVVNLARKLVPQLEARDGAPEGVVLTIEKDKFTGMVAEGDMVVCRVTAPLVGYALACIRNGKKAIVRGRDIGQGLIQMVEKFDAFDLTNLHTLLAEWRDKEIMRLSRRERGSEMAIQAVEDKYETLVAVMDDCDTVAEVLGKLRSLFSNDRVGVVFSTVHRAKGLEAHRVFILRPDLMPHPRAVRPDQIQQELNCLYVAETRAIGELYFVAGK